ncbi:hypothetical protein HYT05_02440 [Candidatus Kaiserbacteria bacterium]|nr:hypothetical protein [Candidatus Kaiserbacteria bacterium]
MSARDLYFSVSGQRYTLRTELYEKLRLLLPKEFPDQTFAFLGNPFPNLSVPLLWDEDERSWDPTSRLFRRWAEMNEFCSKKLVPAIRAGHVAISDGFGINALLHATACSTCVIQNQGAFDFHNEMVGSRLRKQKLPAPRYIITQANEESVDKGMVLVNPRTGNIPREERLAFIQYEERTIRRYFEEIDHQQDPCWLSSESLDEMAEEAIAYIGVCLQVHERVMA